ncbi:MAG: hypothetical protein EBZ47_10665 [Chlamydiae bacterium]|nr:hypothetical protein [Chlamydiota bacterium]
MTAVAKIQFGYLPKDDLKRKSDEKQTSSSYIRKIETMQADEVKPISINKFLKEIDQEFGENNSKATMNYLYTQKEDCHTGWKKFIARIDESFQPNGTLLGKDQKYIADIAHRIFMNIIKP